MSEDEISIPEWGRRIGVSKDSAEKARRLSQVRRCVAIDWLFRVSDTDHAKGVAGARRLMSILSAVGS
jgi:hypothetical protein